MGIDGSLLLLNATQVELRMGAWVWDSLGEDGVALSGVVVGVGRGEAGRVLDAQGPLNNHHIGRRPRGARRSHGNTTGIPIGWRSTVRCVPVERMPAGATVGAKVAQHMALSSPIDHSLGSFFRRQTIPLLGRASGIDVVVVDHRDRDAVSDASLRESRRER